ncbi:MAG: FAD-dependent oxidoreductase, partial [Clostridia bacterium]|nr:FAD-dependent oxidoreductase [Clostridia bacterium]
SDSAEWRQTGYSLLGSTAEKAGNFSLAIESYRKAMEEKACVADLARASLALGKLELQAGDHERADKALRRSVELNGDIKVVHTSDAGDYQTRCVVIATGANARPLGLPNEAALADKGIHYCAACDGMRFKGKTVALVGGGNTALEDALLLSRLCEKVYLIHRRDQYRAEKFYADAVAEAENIEPVQNSVVESVDVEGGFKGVTVKNVQTDETRFLESEALFVSVGRVPNTEFLNGAVAVDGSGYIEADETTRTSVPGVFAVGDIRTKPMRQVVTAAADGAVSSMFAQQYLEESKAK